jgi:hypothetical protein
MYKWEDAWEKGLIEIDTWFERDRAFVGVVDTEGHYLAEWWDDDVQQMFEDGFFKSGRAFERSVVQYLDYLDTPLPEDVASKMRSNPLPPDVERTIVDQLIERLFDRRRG